MPAYEDQSRRAPQVRRRRDYICAWVCGSRCALGGECKFCHFRVFSVFLFVRHASFFEISLRDLCDFHVL